MEHMLEHSFLREDTARTERWKHLTEGITDEYKRKATEQLMDNAQKLADGTLTGAKLEDTTTQSIATWNRTAYPMIQRITQGTVGFDLVSVQPMALPVTMVFFLDFLMSTTQSPTTAGQRVDYAAGHFNRFYTAGVVRDEGLGTGNSSTTVFNTDLYPVRSGSETVYKNSVAQTTGYTIDYTTGAITFSVAPTTGVVLTVDYALVQEGLGSKGNSIIPEMELSMTSAMVGSESRRLKSRWTLDVQQDMQSYHGKSTEKLMVAAMANQLRAEMDRQIIDNLLEGATAGNTNWSKAIPTGTKKGDHYETLIHAMTDTSNEMYKKRFRHANWAVMGPDNITRLSQINSFRATGASTDGKVPTGSIQTGPNVVGTLSEVMRVVVDPLFDADTILLGYKGESFDDTGYIHAPYVSFQTDTFLDPATLKSVKGVQTRYGSHLVNGDCYGTVTVTA